MNINNAIDKDDLIGAAKKAEILVTCLDDIDTDFFGNLNYKQTLLINSDRLRRYIALCLDLACDLTKELHQYGVWCFDNHTD